MIEVTDCSGVMYFDEAIVSQELNLPYIKKGEVYSEWQILPQQNIYR